MKVKANVLQSRQRTIAILPSMILSSSQIVGRKQPNNDRRSPANSHLSSPPIVREKLPYCGEVPMDITRQDATVRYLSECKWGYDTSTESMLFYGRDQDVTLTCYGQGGTVMDDA